MPRFSYTAKSEPHQTIQGEIEAESEQDVIAKLTKMGHFPIFIKNQDSSLEKEGLGVLGLRKIAERELVLFTSQLANLIKSGINILNGLNIISTQTSNKYLKGLINDITAKIKDGKSLSESLGAHPNTFSNLYTALIRSGEIGGTLEVTLERLSGFLEKEGEFKSSIRAALIYPIFVFVVGILTVITLLGFVIPKLLSMFADMGQILPFPTRMLMAISGFLRSYWWLLAILIAISLLAFNRIKRNPQGKILWDSIKLKIAVWGGIILKTEISRLMRTLSLLLSGGIPIVSALEISMSILENQVLKSHIQKFIKQISSGSSFSSCLRSSKLFPELVTHIVTIGEETGALEKSLLRIAEQYEKDVDQALKNFARLLEPIIILAMGLIVGFIVLSMLLPIFQLNLMTR